MWMSYLLMCNVQLFVWGSAGTEPADHHTFFSLEHEEEQMRHESPSPEMSITLFSAIFLFILLYIK